MQKGYGYAKKREKRGKMAYQRSMTHGEVERKDGVPKKHDPKKSDHMKAHKSKIERTASHIQSSKEREVIFGDTIHLFHIPQPIHMHFSIMVVWIVSSFWFNL